MKLLTLDIGATEIKSALFDEHRQMLQTSAAPSRGSEGAEALMSAVYTMIDEYEGFAGVGVACTGQVDAQTGRIVYANRNVNGFTGMELGRELATRLDVPVTVDNDANAAAIGEGAFGAARGTRDYLCLTYGTGVGGAIIINNEVYGGQGGVAGELGHMLTHPEGLKCACGNRGCYEQYASVTALMRCVQEVFPDIHNGRELFALLDAKPALRDIVDAWVREVAYGLVTLTHIFNLSLIVLGGGIMTQPYVLKRLEQAYLPAVMKSYQPVQLRQAQLGNLAGAYGAFHRIVSHVSKIARSG